MITAAVTELFRDLEEGALAITSTRRLARQVEQRYADWKMHLGVAAWATPWIRVYDDWLHETWSLLAAHESSALQLLSEDQELLLWEKVIQHHTTGAQAPYLLQLSSTARAARQSWQRIHQWELDWQGLRDHRSADTEALMQWAEALGQRLKDNRWITSAQLSRCLLERPQDWPVGRAARVWWMGFDSVPTVLARMMDVLRDRGVRQRHYRNPGVSGPEAATVECSDAEDQWQRVARWARRELSADPRTSLGVVCPDLQGQRDRIEDILEDVLHPELAWRVDAPRAFHISLGRSLAEYPIIKAALDLLHWTRRRIPFDIVSRSLRSPYLGGGETGLSGRVELELLLRKQRQESFTLRHLDKLARRVDGLDGFAVLVKTAAETSFPESAAPAEWAAILSEWLHTFGWPGERPLDSHEFQTVHAWREQLARFAGLGVVRQRWTLDDVRAKLSSTVSMRTLQYHDDQAPLQIMGAGEAAGLWFDKLWLADMSDSVWPPSHRPDPFIPVSLQKASGMPEASAQSVLEYTGARTRDLLAAAALVRISFASSQEGAPASLSPMFTGFPADAESGEDPAGRSDQLMRHPARLELIEDQQAPPLAGGSLYGGVALIADQAKCPFRALAHHRLKARELDEAGPGLDAGQRGTLVHDAARRLWQALRNQHTLLSMEAADVRRLVSEAVAGAVAELVAHSPFQIRFLEIERNRLEALFVEWLVLERQRGPFRVLETELETHLELRGVRFRLRVDRIDELADGRHLVIDYKTGRLPRVDDWTEARMEEPQLPIYALTRSEDVSALALAGIRRGECELRGVADAGLDALSLRSVSELGFDSMSRLQDWWRSALGELVDEYVRGVARVDPRNTNICRLCDAASLCRIFERDQRAEV